MLRQKALLKGKMKMMALEENEELMHGAQCADECVSGNARRCVDGCP